MRSTAWVACFPLAWWWRCGEGFRNGGNNPVKPASILPRSFDSDTLENFEVGAKTEWLDNRLRLNAAAYYMKWNDFAVQVEDPSDFFQLGYVNLPTAEIPGVELELTFAASDAWQIDASLGWNDAEISEATELRLENDDGDVFTKPVEKGARLPLTPDWSASLGFEWRPRGQLLNSQPFARLDLAYVDNWSITGDLMIMLRTVRAVTRGQGAY